MNSSYKRLTTFDLKIIGIILMFIDHIHQMFSWAGVPNWVDWFGRPVATLFFFISVEGFSHTRNKKKYLSRLLYGFWAMIIGTSIVEHFFSFPEVALQNNIFTDLLIGALAMYAIDEFRTFKQTKQQKHLWIGLASLIGPLISSLLFLWSLSTGNFLLINFLRFVPSLVMTENTILIYIIPLMYLAKDYRVRQYLIIVVASLFYLLRAPGLAFTMNIQWMLIFALIPIMLYNGQKGRGMRSFFYIFYPVHIWILYIIASLMYTR